jgi:hypothetical protein
MSAFYHRILKLVKKAKPSQPAARGGCELKSGALQVHLASRRISSQRIGRRPFGNRIELIEKHAQ